MRKVFSARDHAGGGGCKHASLVGLGLNGWPRETWAPCLLTAGKVGPLPHYRGKCGPAASLTRERWAPPPPYLVKGGPAASFPGWRGTRAAEPPLCSAPAHDRERRTIERQQVTETAYRSDMLARGAERDRVGILRRARCARLAPVARHQRACTPESLGRYTELSSQVSLRLRCGRLKGPNTRNSGVDIQ
jgi:hypothetical protein